MFAVLVKVSSVHAETKKSKVNLPFRLTYDQTTNIWEYKQFIML